jgi:hypothetical protein
MSTLKWLAKATSVWGCALSNIFTFLKSQFGTRNALIAWHGHYRSIESIIKIVDSS